MSDAAIGAILPVERAGQAADDGLRRLRAQFAAGPYEGEVPVTDRSYAGVPCRVLSGGDSVTVLYLHGGGYRMGSAETYTPYGARLASAAGATVVLVDYRLAPEHPFPAALRDAVAVYEALRAEVPPSHPVVAAGDSAGGGLAAAVAVAAAAAGAPRPDGLALLSPWLDLRCGSATYETATDPLFDQVTATTARETYLQGHDPGDPLASPLLADASVLPPTLIQVGTTESLLGEALSFVTNLSKADIGCRLEVVADRGHTWPLIEPAHPDSLAAVVAFGRFVRGIAARHSASARR